MGYQPLKDELLVDPLGRGYSEMSDQAAADDINTVYRDVPAEATVDQVRQFLITELDGAGAAQRSALDMVREYAEDGTVRGVSAGENAPEARRSGGQMIWYMLSEATGGEGGGGIDPFFPVDDTNVQAQFIAIGSDGGNGPGVLTNAQLNAIDALATRTISRAAELGMGVVKPGHVEGARS